MKFSTLVKWVSLVVGLWLYAGVLIPALLDLDNSVLVALGFISMPFAAYGSYRYIKHFKLID